MAQSHTPVQVDPEALKHAQDNWHGFTLLMKYGLISVIVILIGMAVFLV